MKKKKNYYPSGLSSGEAGQTLIIVLIFLLLGSLTLVPTLTHIGTALKTGETYEENTHELYTADSGVEDAIWRIKYDFMGIDYNPYDFESTWPYETEDVNGLAADFTIKNVWFPSDFTLDDWDGVGLTPDTARTMIELGKLVVIGTAGAICGQPYSVRINFTPDVGDNLSVKSLGVWLPQGFEYITGNCSLLDDGPTVYYPDSITYSEAPGGHTIVWSYDEDYPLFAEFPGVDPQTTPMTLEFTFGYTPPEEHPNLFPLAIAWITTNMEWGSLGYPNPNNVPVSWDVDARYYKIVSEAGDTTVEAYSSKSELRQMGDAMSGDYIAIGNSLLSDKSTPKDNIRETWNTPSSVEVGNPQDEVPDIPANADVAYAYLYWSGWRNDAAKQYPLPNDACANFNNWTRSSDYLSQTRNPTGDISRSGTWDKTTNMYTYVDEVGANDGDTSYLLHGTTAGNALFSFPVFTVPAGYVIQNLTVTLVAKDDTSGTNNRMQPALRIGGSNYLTTSTSTSVPTSYGSPSISYTYTYNPARSGSTPWTSDDINGIGSYALQGFGVNSANANPKIRVTQVYAQVTYCESRWAIFSERFQGQGSASASTAQRTLTLTNHLDLHSYTPTTVVLSWEQYGSGNLESADALYFALSGDGGSTWSDNIEAFHDDPGDDRYFWYPIPEDYLTNNFKVRFYFNFNDASEYVQLDNINVIYMEPDTSITFKIGNVQVYFNGSEPADGPYPLTAGRSYAMFNNLWGAPEGFSYACVRDVSALVKKYPVVEGEEHHTGNTIYTVNAVAANTGSNFSFAGWSLIIVYVSPQSAGHYIYIRDNNFAFHPGTDPNYSLDFDDDGIEGGKITNFKVPNPITDQSGNVTETVAARLTCFVVEGDNFGTSSIQISDNLSGPYKSYWNSASPSPDVWNGQSYPGTFNEGVDIDTFTVYWTDNVGGIPIVKPKDDTIYVDMYSLNDAWNLVYFIISIRSETNTSGTTHYTIHSG